MLDTTSILVMVATAALAASIATALAVRIAFPVVVIELLLGIVIGPEVLDIAHVNDFTNFFGALGLGMLFFFAGYEIDFERIRGWPLQVAVLGWGLSLGIAYGVGGLLVAVGAVVSLLYTGSAMATTAIGTLIPILRDAGELRTRFGTYLLAAGAIGEFGPVLLITLVLSTTHPFSHALILLAFVALAVLTGVVAIRGATAGWPALERTFEASTQLAIRMTVVLLAALIALAYQLGLDLLLGGFVAGMITRLALHDRELTIFESKLAAIGYGFLIPFFFILSGMKFDIDSLFGSATALLKLPMFVVLFFLVRGTPALLLYRRTLPGRDRLALAFYSSTELPLVVAITAVATATHHMRTSTASALVGAAIVSTLVYPLVALRLRRGRVADAEPEPEAPPPEAPVSVPIV